MPTLLLRDGRLTIPQTPTEGAPMITEPTPAEQAIPTEPFPVRTTVGSQLAGILVEIDVVARVAP